jgi:metal-sulfur cluster biosynthetic enzyme
VLPEIPKGEVAHITMTTTTLGCPAANYLKSVASRSAAEIEGVTQVGVELTYNPRWTPEMMKADAKSHLGIG